MTPIAALLAFILTSSSLHNYAVATRKTEANWQHTSRNLRNIENTLEPDDPARNGKDYWERLVGTPSRLAHATVKEGVLPASKFSMETFDALPFQVIRLQTGLWAVVPGIKRSNNAESSGPGVQNDQCEITHSC